MSQSEGQRLSSGRVRNLSVEDLGLTPPGAHAGQAPDDPDRADTPEPLPGDSPLLIRVKHLLHQFGGVIFVGPSGTSKSHFAARVAMALAGSSARVRFVQFHASYQ